MPHFLLSFSGHPTSTYNRLTQSQLSYQRKVKWMFLVPPSIRFLPLSKSALLKTMKNNNNEEITKKLWIFGNVLPVLTTYILSGHLISKHIFFFFLLSSSKPIQNPVKLSFYGYLNCMGLISIYVSGALWTFFQVKLFQEAKFFIILPRAFHVNFGPSK